MRSHHPRVSLGSYIDLELLNSGRIMRGQRGPGPPERPGGPLKTPGLRGYKGPVKFNT